MSTPTQQTRDGKIEPVFPKTAQAGTPHASSTDLSLTHYTQSTWGGGAASKRGWFWPNPDAAPTVNSSSLNTDLAFKMEEASSGGATADFSVIWQRHKRATAVDILITIAYDGGSSAANLISFKAFRGSGTPLNVAPNFSVQGARVLASSVQSTPRGLWTRGQRLYTLSTFMVRVNPTQDLFLLQPLAMFRSMGGTTSVGVINIMKIWSLRIKDFIESPLA